MGILEDSRQQGELTKFYLAPSLGPGMQWGTPLSDGPGWTHVSCLQWTDVCLVWTTYLDQHVI